VRAGTPTADEREVVPDFADVVIPGFNPPVVMLYVPSTLFLFKGIKNRFDKYVEGTYRPARTNHAKVQYMTPNNLWYTKLKKAYVLPNGEVRRIGNVTMKNPEPKCPKGLTFLLVRIHLE